MTEDIGNSLNSPTTTLSSSITNSSTTIPVNAPTSPDVWPTGGNFRIRIGTEIVIVTAATSSATSLTVVTRGAEGTTAASAASGDAVDIVLTKGAIDNFLRPPGDPVPASPNAADDEFTAAAIDSKWAWRNQGSATITQANGQQTLKSPAGDSGQLRVREQNAPGGNFTLSVKFAALFGGGTTHESGLCFVNSTNGRLITLDCALFAANHIKLNRWTSVSAFSASVIDITQPPSLLIPRNLYLRLQVVSSVITPFYSFDGVNWTKFSGTTEAVSAFLTASGGGSLDKIGFFVTNSDANSDAFVVVEWLRVT